MASVTVRGTAAASVTPDRAELCLDLSHRAPDAPSALDEVARRSQQLESILVNHGFARTDWATEGMQVGEEYQWKNDRNVLIGYRASTALTVTIRSLDLVGRVIRDGVTEAGASVRSLTWKVDRDNPTRRALLADAARDAKVRALAYVEALDLGLGEVEQISETPIVAEPGPQPRMASMAMDAKVGGGHEMELSGGLVELTADVHVRFGVLV
jgi:uncharacterized protein YggE